MGQALKDDVDFDLHIKKLDDLSLRQITSIGFYPLVYFVCFSPVFFGEHSRECLFRVLVMGSVLVVAVAVRFLVLRNFRIKLKGLGAPKSSAQTSLTLFLCAFIWGAIISYSQIDEELFEHYFALLAGYLALIGGGVLASCIDTRAMVLFVCSIGLPPVITVFALETLAPRQIGVIIALYCLGMMWVAILPKREYDRMVSVNFELKRVLADQYKRNSIDWLTKIKNRSYFESALRCELERSVELSIPLSILVIDIDHFKTVNDTFGHSFGDFTLLTTAQRIEHSIKHSSDLVARYGGEEFCVLLPGVGQEKGFNVAERLRKDIQDNSITRGSVKMNVTISIGGYTFMGDSTMNHQQAFNLADEALYRAKRNGRNQTQWFSQTGCNESLID